MLRFRIAFSLTVLGTVGIVAGRARPCQAAEPGPLTAAPADADGSAARGAKAENVKIAAKKKTAATIATDDGAVLPFRLGLFYAHAFGQSGNLTHFINPGNGAVGFALPSPAAVGLDLGIGLGGHIRYHFGVGLEWESQNGYAAKGFRFDPVTLGFPILVWRNEDVAIHVEPLVHLVRGEILFQSQPMTTRSSLFRIESGFAAAVTAVWRHWFVGLEPLAVDFRVFEADSEWVHTGFSHLWWFQLTAGHEF